MPALVAGIHVFTQGKDVDGRDKPGHDGIANPADGSGRLKRGLSGSRYSSPSMIRKSRSAAWLNTFRAA